MHHGRAAVHEPHIGKLQPRRADIVGIAPVVREEGLVVVVGVVEGKDGEGGAGVTVAQLNVE